MEEDTDTGISKFTIIEGIVKFRDNKKWKSRWCVMRKLSPVADCLHLQLYRRYRGDNKDKYAYVRKQTSTKASLSLQYFLGFETGFTLDKESNTVAIICQDLVVVLAFDTREHLIEWQVKICNHLGEGKQFLVKIFSTPQLAAAAKSSSKLNLSSLAATVTATTAGAAARLHIQEYKLCLTTGTPPKLLDSWEIKHLRRFGVVDGSKFCFEGGSYCGRGREGLYVFLTEQSEEITRCVQLASKGKLNSSSSNKRKTPLAHQQQLRIMSSTTTAVAVDAAGSSAPYYESVEQQKSFTLAGGEYYDYAHALENHMLDERETAATVTASLKQKIRSRGCWPSIETQLDIYEDEENDGNGQFNSSLSDFLDNYHQSATHLKLLECNSRHCRRNGDENGSQLARCVSCIEKLSSDSTSSRPSTAANTPGSSNFTPCWFREDSKFHTASSSFSSSPPSSSSAVAAAAGEFDCRSHNDIRYYKRATKQDAFSTVEHDGRFSSSNGNDNGTGTGTFHHHHHHHHHHCHCQHSLSADVLSPSSLSALSSPRKVLRHLNSSTLPLKCVGNNSLRRDAEDDIRPASESMFQPPRQHCFQGGSGGRGSYEEISETDTVHYNSTAPFTFDGDTVASPTIAPKGEGEGAAAGAGEREKEEEEDCRQEQHPYDYDILPRRTHHLCVKDAYANYDVLPPSMSAENRTRSSDNFAKFCRSSPAEESENNKEFVCPVEDEKATCCFCQRRLLFSSQPWLQMTSTSSSLQHFQTTANYCSADLLSCPPTKVNQPVYAQVDLSKKAKNKPSTTLALNEEHCKSLPRRSNNNNCFTRLNESDKAPTDKRTSIHFEDEMGNYQRLATLNYMNLEFTNSLRHYENIRGVLSAPPPQQQQKQSYPPPPDGIDCLNDGNLRKGKEVERNMILLEDKNDRQQKQEQQEVVPCERNDEQRNSKKNGASSLENVISRNVADVLFEDYVSMSPLKSDIRARNEKCSTIAAAVDITEEESGIDQDDESGELNGTSKALQQYGNNNRSSASTEVTTGRPSLFPHANATAITSGDSSLGTLSLTRHSQKKTAISTNPTTASSCISANNRNSCSSNDSGFCSSPCSFKYLTCGGREQGSPIVAKSSLRKTISPPALTSAQQQPQPQPSPLSKKRQYSLKYCVGNDGEKDDHEFYSNQVSRQYMPRRSKSSDPLRNLTFNFPRVTCGDDTLRHKSSSAEAELPLKLCPPSRDCGARVLVAAFTNYVETGTKSTSSGASDISDYIDETLSVSSRGSTDVQPAPGTAALAHSTSVATTLKPRSGNEYQKIDRISLLNENSKVA